MKFTILATFEQIGSLIAGGAMVLLSVAAAVYDIGVWVKKKIRKNGHR